ncbi:MAG: DUF2339 domain-containing protein [Acidobacteriota bacterium]|nr:DUF2339 domain-containing protein [Acidobacteriota bacterium]
MDDMRGLEEMPGLHERVARLELEVALLRGMVAGAPPPAVTQRLARLEPEESFWRSCAVGSMLAFNLLAVLTGVREIQSMWRLSSGGMGFDEALLKHALAISAYLMVYGAALLAAGFWKWSALLRWQGLVLLVFTIFKTFLYDMRTLSQGYRVVSFLALGALLMAISFAYQKDWLHLREGSDAVEALR